MDDSPRHLSPSEPRQAALQIVQALRSAGHIAYFAGGCVRDELLGREPDDYDIATDATPDRIAAIFKRTSHVGASFGVVLVKYEQPEARGGPSQTGTIEVATFRADGSYTDKRRPDQVHFSDPAADAQRRDFTINALFLDPIDPPDSAIHANLPGSPRLAAGPNGGTVVDFVGGLDDLPRRLLRAVGDPEKRLAEDHLRALRAVRLTAKLGISLDPATADAIRRHAAELGGVSRERIGDEIRMVMALAGRANAVRMLADLGLEPAILGQPLRGAVHAGPGGLLALLPVIGAGFPTCLAAWAIDREFEGLSGLWSPDPDAWQGKPSPAVLSVVGRWRASLCLSNEERDALCSTLQCAGMLADAWPRLSLAHRRRLAASPWFQPARRLLEAGQTVGLFILTTTDQITADLDGLRATPPGLGPEPLVTGDDLLAAGFKPGPGYRKLLEMLYDAQLEARIASREEGLELARSLRI